MGNFLFAAKYRIPGTSIVKKAEAVIATNASGHSIISIRSTVCDSFATRSCCAVEAHSRERCVRRGKPGDGRSELVEADQNDY
jgi:hypothetical protein